MTRLGGGDDEEEDHADVVSRLQCSHEFHGGCVGDWVTTCNRKGLPLTRSTCRRPLHIMSELIRQNRKSRGRSKGGGGCSFIARNLGGFKGKRRNDERKDAVKFFFPKQSNKIRFKDRHAFSPVRS